MSPFSEPAFRRVEQFLYSFESGNYRLPFFYQVISLLSNLPRLWKQAIHPLTTLWNSFACWMLVCRRGRIHREVASHDLDTHQSIHKVGSNELKATGYEGENSCWFYHIKDGHMNPPAVTDIATQAIYNWCTILWALLDVMLNAPMYLKMQIASAGRNDNCARKGG